MWPLRQQRGLEATPTGVNRCPQAVAHLRHLIYFRFEDQATVGKRVTNTILHNNWGYSFAAFQNICQLGPTKIGSCRYKLSISFRGPFPQTKYWVCNCVKARCFMLTAAAYHGEGLGLHKFSSAPRSPSPPPGKNPDISPLQRKTWPRKQKAKDRKTPK